MKLAAILSVTIALALGMTPPRASAGETQEFCCVCFNCDPVASVGTGGAAAPPPAPACFTGFSEDEALACLHRCNLRGCQGDLFKGACSLFSCASIDPGITTEAPIFQPLGMVVAMLAAGLAGAWSLLRRRSLRRRAR